MYILNIYLPAIAYVGMLRMYHKLIILIVMFMFIIKKTTRCYDFATNS